MNHLEHIESKIWHMSQEFELQLAVWRFHEHKIVSTATCNGTSVKPNSITKGRNTHPTVKPIKLMSYLITMGSREGDIVLDPFCGSATTGVAAMLLGRKFICIENSPD